MSAYLYTIITDTDWFDIEADGCELMDGFIALYDRVPRTRTRIERQFRLFRPDIEREIEVTESFRFHKRLFSKSSVRSISATEAQAIEAQRAATPKSDAVEDESAVAKPCAQGDSA